MKTLAVIFFILSFTLLSVAEDENLRILHLHKSRIDCDLLLNLLPYVHFETDDIIQVDILRLTQEKNIKSLANSFEHYTQILRPLLEQWTFLLNLDWQFLEGSSTLIGKYERHSSDPLKYLIYILEIKTDDNGQTIATVQLEARLPFFEISSTQQQEFLEKYHHISLALPIGGLATNRQIEIKNTKEIGVGLEEQISLFFPHKSLNEPTFRKILEGTFKIGLDYVGKF